MFRVITANLNGIRSAARKGFFAWLANQEADVVCLQELKAQQKELEDSALRLPGYHAYFHFAEKKGYSGVAIYSRHEPADVVTGLGWEAADQEGRYVAIKLGNLWVASLYLPSGSSGDERQAVKFDFLDRYKIQLEAIKQANQDMIICGDWNIAHKPIDLKNWKGNQKNSGFLPEERAWLDTLFGELAFVDAFREVNQAPDEYTWWSHRGQARAKNVGWRIDYQVTTPGLKSAVKSASIYRSEHFSDHAPLIMDYDITLA
jgi:exodeoxyribonuclease-3